MIAPLEWRGPVNYPSRAGSAPARPEESIEASVCLLSKVLRFVLLRHPGPNSPEKALHERHAQDNDDAGPNGGECVGNHLAIVYSLLRLEQGEAKGSHKIGWSSSP
jgi:hypothetical protein